MNASAPRGDDSTSADTATRTARALPKVLLHEHLDGDLSVPTLLDLLHQRGIPAPAAGTDTVEGLAAWFEANAHAGSLERYLEGFALTVAAMATPDAMARVAFEAAETARAQGALLAEFRIAPLLFEPHGVSGDAAVEALLAGLAKSPLPTGLIVCAMRHLPESETERAVDLALHWFDKGLKSAGPRVVAFDLAGAERGFPPALHARAIARVRAAGMPMTLHAGEADIAERVVESGRLGATRIGHGVRLADALADPARRHLVDEVLAMGLHLEVCPTSNVHTGAARSLAEHPITALVRAGVSVGLNTDNTLMSCITLESEAADVLRETPLVEADLIAMARAAAKASFIGGSAQADAVKAIEAAAAARGVVLR